MWLRIRFDTTPQRHYYSPLMSAIWFGKSAVAELGRSGPLTAALEVDRLPRLNEAVVPPSGPIEAQVAFGNDGENVLVDASLRGAVSVACQRCLEPMTLAVDSRMRLALVADDTAVAPDGYESLFVPDGEVRLADLVEDEILLGIPFSARHPDGECGALAQALEDMRGSSEATRPFAGLAALLRDKDN